MMKRIIALLVLFVLAFSVSAQADSFNAEHAMAFMEITFTCGCSRVGTGAMIGRRGLVTAAHNPFHHPGFTPPFLYHQENHSYHTR